MTAAASSVGWTQSFVNDGFGNLWSQTMTGGTATPMSVNVNMAANRINSSGWSYDDNGNTTGMPVAGGTAVLAYDIENRLTTWSGPGGVEEYRYLADNKRVWKKAPNGTETVYFYGVGGQKLVSYTVQNSPFALISPAANVYFGGKPLRADGAAVAHDRLGSVVWRGGVKHDYLPYGEEMGTSTAGNVDKFGTYHRDQTTGLDYADQRYFAGLSGRFLSSDPYEASGGTANPGSWGRYAYVGGDPVNFHDPKGLLSCWNGGTISYGSGPTLTSMVRQGDFGEPIVGVKEYATGPFLSAAQEQDLMVRVQEDLADLDSPGGLRTFRGAFRTVASTDFSKCERELTRVTGQGIESIRAQARMSAGFIYDGTTSPVIWDSSRYGAPPSGNLSPQNTMAAEFAGGKVDGISQRNGHAIFIRPAAFEASLANLVLSLNGTNSVDAA